MTSCRQGRRPPVRPWASRYGLNPRDRAGSLSGVRALAMLAARGHFLSLDPVAHFIVQRPASPPASPPASLASKQSPSRALLAGFGPAWIQLIVGSEGSPTTRGGRRAHHRVFQGCPVSIVAGAFMICLNRKSGGREPPAVGGVPFFYNASARAIWMQGVRCGRFLCSARLPRAPALPCRF